MFIYCGCAAVLLYFLLRTVDLIRTNARLKRLLESPESGLSPELDRAAADRVPMGWLCLRAAFRRHGRAFRVDYLPRRIWLGPNGIRILRVSAKADSNGAFVAVFSEKKKLTSGIYFSNPEMQRCAAELLELGCIGMSLRNHDLQVYISSSAALAASRAGGAVDLIREIGSRLDGAARILPAHPS